MQSSSVEIGGVTSSGGGVRAPLIAVGGMVPCGMTSGEPFKDSGGEAERSPDVDARVAILRGAMKVQNLFKPDAKEEISAAQDVSRTLQISWLTLKRDMPLLDSQHRALRHI